MAAEVRAEMARQRVSQSELAERLGRNQPWVSVRLTGQVPFVVDDLNDVCRALGVSIVTLFGRVTDPDDMWLDRRGQGQPNITCVGAADPVHIPEPLLAAA